MVLVPLFFWFWVTWRFPVFTALLEMLLVLISGFFKCMFQPGCLPWTPHTHCRITYLLHHPHLTFKLRLPIFPPASISSSHSLPCCSCSGWKPRRYPWLCYYFHWQSVSRIGSLFTQPHLPPGLWQCPLNWSPGFHVCPQSTLITIERASFF